MSSATPHFAVPRSRLAQAFAPELEEAVLLCRFLVPCSLIFTLVLTFGSKAFAHFVWKLQNVGYDALAQADGPYSPSNLATARVQPGLRSSAPHPDGPSSSAGVIPVVIPLKKPRRGPTYAVHALIILSYFLDGALICVRAVWSRSWEPNQVPAWRGLDWYVVACTLAFVGCVSAMSVQEKVANETGAWGKGYTRVFAAQAWLGELVVGFLSFEILSSGFHSSRSAPLLSPAGSYPVGVYDILHWINGVCRILLVTLLCLLQTKWLWQKEFVPICSLRGEASQQPGYGTFTPSSGDNGHVLSTKAQLREPPQPTGILKMMKRIKVLFPYLWPRRSRALQSVAVICFLVLLVGRGVNLMVPIALGQATEDLSQGKRPWLHLGLYVGLRFLMGSGGLVSVVQQNLWIPVAQYADRSMSMMSFTHLLDLSLSYHTRRKTAEVLRILDRGSAINQFFQLLIFSLVPIFLDIALAVGYLAFRFDLLLATMLFLVMVAYVAASILLTQWRTALRREMVDRDKYTRGIQGDSLLNWETIAWFNTKSFETKRYLDATIDYQRSEFAVMSSLYTLNMAQNTIIAVSLLIGSYAVAFQVSEGRRTVGDFVLFVTYVGQLLGPLNSLGTLYRVIQQNLTDTDNLMKLLAEPKEIQDRPTARAVSQSQGTIEFENVSFSYDGKTSALDNVSFSVPAGSSVALVGESGSGKSTMLRLLFRFYDPTAGSIKLDGVDIRDLTQVSYRSQIGSVPQDAALFNDTIRYNIAYGAIGVKPGGPTMDDVIEAAKAAQIHNRIMSFPDGYETRVGERGVRLSGGEKQRVAIARVMIRNPPVILLDEATSALDTTTEREIQEALQRLGQGRTTVAIAHRLSTIVNSDVILVIDKGRIVERGTHTDLLAAKGIYSDLWTKQIRAEVEAGAVGGARSLSKVSKTSLTTPNVQHMLSRSGSVNVTTPDGTVTPAVTLSQQ